ncbi:potassium-transporting ATPase subunit KdpA [Stenotrophomonas maltophilia]|jgi:K+-transporting ATPase ATPase A chain|uniref:Potassium-transporting ATPase potassium-binding subunit n=1 Tax=Stenotrophomonas maltophilia TaxID=40324 RepID=A0A246HRC1_STEMA|nr:MULTISPECIES: potassium-transporting ATPase subunit KdpA [Stenotrophomonas]MBW8373211.1 potassium-transporting ATPase subunit KdpA [Stenotrophomonas sp.]OWQ56694.1 potassium-transporting ATPase subunit KdpA [Stenotrophomonas maltophilia]
MTEILLILLASIVLAFPLGLYLARVMRGGPMRGDALFGWIEKPLYRLLGVNPARGMSWRGYVGAFLLSNVVIAVLVQAVFMTQAWLPFNPDQIPNMRWDTALHTMVSFLTNTNQQHYSGQAQLSYFSQMTAITGLQVVTPMMGLALVVATLRALFGARPEDVPADQAALLSADRRVDVGNYYADVVRSCVRFMLPLCLLWAVLLTSQGVPSTLAGGPQATPIDAAAGMETQKLPLGPVAAMVAAKQLGTNGGGWYGPNSAMPLENPTPLSNALELIGILLIPIAVIFMLGAFTGRKRLAGLVFGCMLAMSSVSIAATVWLEGHSATAASPLLMEGKEVRFGADGTGLWAAITTQVSNGSVNGMHDSLSPLAGAVPMVNMLVNAIWGGIGCGLQQFIVYLLLGVFLAGLMTGRTPELFGRKLETPQVRLLALLVLLQPITILGFTALTLAIPSITGTSNPGFHGISQVFYEYTSAFANNGSGFEGLGDATVWWNLSCTLVLLLGRYPVLVIPLIVAAQLAAKRRAPESAGTLQIETPTFALTLIALIVILTVLQFMPALVLGPVADHLSLTLH